MILYQQLRGHFISLVCCISYITSVMILYLLNIKGALYCTTFAEKPRRPNHYVSLCCNGCSNSLHGTSLNSFCLVLLNITSIPMIRKQFSLWICIIIRILLTLWLFLWIIVIVTIFIMKRRVSPMYIMHGRLNFAKWFGDNGPGCLWATKMTRFFRGFICEIWPSQRVYRTPLR